MADSPVPQRQFVVRRRDLLFVRPGILVQEQLAVMICRSCTSRIGEPAPDECLLNGVQAPVGPQQASTVRMLFPAREETFTTHDRATSPSMSTAQDPQTPMPQPYFVPLRPRPSRSAHSKVPSP
jgi:hypothetical protein